MYSLFARRKTRNNNSIFQNNNKNDIAVDLLDGLNRLRDKGTFCDIKLKVGDTLILAHKNVLCACSPYFSAMFSGPFLESDQDEIVIKDVDAACLKILVDYLYTGMLKFDASNVERVLLTASFLQITSAEEVCCSYLINNLALENCIDYIIFAGKHSIKKLVQKALQMAVINFHHILTKNDYLAIDFEEFKLLTQRLNANGYIEDAIYSCTMRWIYHSYENRVQYLQDLLEFLEPALISPDLLISSRVAARPNHYLDHWASPATSVISNETHVQILISKRIGDFHPRAVKIFTQSEQRQIEMLPEKIFDGSYVCNGYYIYHQGGWKNKKQVTSDSFAYNQRNNIWVPYVPLQQARAYHRSCVLHGTIYTLGGSDGLKALPSVEFVDLHSGRTGWCEPLLRAKEQMGVAIYENSLYTVGGRDRARRLKCVHRMDPRMGKWEEIVTTPYRSGASSCAVVYDDIYTTHYDGLQRYDVRANRWTLIHTQYKRYPEEVFALNHKLYGLFKDHIARYVPDEGKWEMQRTLKYRHDYLRVSTNLRLPHIENQEFNIIMDDMDENIDNDMFEV